MERRTALAAAAAVALALTAGSIAVAANLGLLNAAGDPEPVGELLPASQQAPAPVETGTIDDHDSGTTDDRTEPATAGARESDDHAEDHDDEGAEQGSSTGEHETEGAEHEYEGRDDDD